MTTEERKIQLGVGVDATGARKGFSDVKEAARDMAQAVVQSGNTAGKSLDGLGTGGDKAAKNVNRSTGSMVGSIQRLTAELTAGEKGTRKYFEVMGDFKGIPREALEPSLKALDEVRSKQGLATAALASGGIQFDKYGMSAKQTAAAMRGVPAQMTDIIVSLQGGQKPLTVLLQQGGQLKDLFGGIVPAARALGAGVMAMVNPFTLAAAAIAGIYTVYRMGASESEAFTKTLLMTGNAAGVTTAQLQGMAARMDGVIGTQRSASAALNQFAASTKIGSGNLEEFATAALRWEEATGTAVADTVKHFEELGKDPLKASLKLNESMNYLTASVYDQITALVEQGKETEAAAVAQKAFADTINDRAPAIVQNIGTIERAWVGVKNAVAGAISAFAGIGRATGLAEQLASEEAKLLQLQDGAYQRGASRRVEQVRQQELIVEGIRNQISQESALGMIQKQVDDERTKALKATQDLNSYLGDNSRLSRTAQMEKDVAKEKTLYAARVADAKGNTDTLQKLETAHQVALAGIKDKYKEKKGQKSEALKELERQQKAELKAIEDFEKERKKAIEGQYKEISAISAKAEKVEDEIAAYGMSKAAIEALTISRLEEQKVMLSGMYGDKAGNAVAAIEAEIEARERLGKAIAGKDRLDAEKKANEETKREWEKTVDQYGDVFRTGFADMLNNGKDGWKSFTKSLVTTFKTSVADQIYKLFAQPFVVKMVASISGITGAGGASANQQGGGGSGGIVQNANSLNSVFGAGYQALTGANAGASTASLGYANAVGAFGGDSIGALISANGGWEGAMSGFGSAAGTAAAAGTVAGITSLGAGLGASLGATIGTSTAAMATTTFAASVGGAAAAGGAAAGGAAMGGMGAAMGAIGTAMPYIGAAVAVASALGVFDSGPPKTRHSQRTTAELTGGTFGITERDDRIGAGGAEAVQQMADASVKAANEIFSKVGVNAAIDSFYAIMESSVLGDRNGVASGGTLRSGDGTTSNIGIGKASDMTVAGFGGWSEEEMLPRLATDIQLSILQAFQQKAGELPKVMADMLNGVDIRGLGTEETAALIARFYGVVTEVESFRMALDTLPFDSLKKLSFDAAAGLIAAAGGLESLNTGLASYYQNFYSQEEQLTLAAKNIETALSGVSLAMPDVTQGATAAKDAFRSLFESLDPATESGAAAIATMLGLNESFAQLAAGMEQLNAASAQAAEQERQKATQAAQDFSTRILAEFTDRAGVIDVSGMTARLMAATEQGFVTAIVQVFESLASRIASVIDSIASERSAVQDAIRQVQNIGALTPDAIARQIAGINTAMPGNAGVVAAYGQLSAADAAAAQRKAQESAYGNQYGSAKAQYDAAQGSFGSAQAQAIAAQNRQSQAQQALDAAQARVIQLEADIYGPKTVPYKSGNWGALNAAREAAYPQIDGARAALQQAQAESQAAQQAAAAYQAQLQAAQGGVNAAPGKSAVDQLAAQYAAAVTASAQAQAAATEAATKARQSQVDYANALQNFTIDAGKSVGKLSELRNETLRYYEAQEALAGLMKTSADKLRSTAQDYRVSQLGPDDQFTYLRGEFEKAYSMALSTEGEDLVGYADKLSAMLNPLIQKAGDVYASDAGLNSFIATALARVENIAGRVEMLTPQDYQADSLALLNQIDATLAALDGSTKSAEAIIADAINSSRDSLLEGLRQIANALAGKPIAAFASGGYHTGGLRIVGENGPELEATGPSRIFSASQTAAMFSGGGNAEMLAELRSLRNEVANLRIEARATASNTAKTARDLDRIGQDGLIVRTEADTPLQTVAA